ncbi:unnamed protein product [Bursaphelenchus xylophilus]|uniref:(pine wood nematode) hypothetical protein n=1 Tax=Bursaphelenchus xylophilus TaxID=6326 RepID=A0A1I7RLP9_BURXY|nr:unnamed protein product [Bursaphelenchus xylophilus]CAG9082720.1 unnamed protein product [Bursaphelenchus xylophilus]
MSFFFPKAPTEIVDPKEAANTDRREVFLACIFFSCTLFMAFVSVMMIDGFNPVLTGFTLFPAILFASAAIGNKIRNSTLYIPALLMSLFFFSIGYFLIIALIVGEICILFQPKEKRQYEFLQHADTPMLVAFMVLLDMSVIVTVHLFLWVFRVMKRDYHRVLESESLKEEINSVEKQSQQV